MYFNHGFANYAMLNMMDTCKKNLVFLPEKERKEFEQTVRGMTGEFTEGQELPADKLTVIRDAAKKVIHKMTDRLVETQAEKSPAFKAKFKPAQYLIMATEQLYTQAMAFLGCPDIPYMFGGEMHKEIKDCAQTLEKAYNIENIATGTTYHAQRRKNASALRSSYMNALLANVKSEDATPDQVGKLVAEYQALQKRQAGHGSVWRFFHRLENNARTNLLAEMKDALTTRLGADFDIEKGYPNAARQAMIKPYIEGQFNKTANEHLDDLSKYYGVENLIPESVSSTRERIPVSERELLFNDARVNEAVNAPIAEKNVEKDVPTTGMTK